MFVLHEMTLSCLNNQVDLELFVAEKNNLGIKCLTATATNLLSIYEPLETCGIPIKDDHAGTYC